MRIFPPPPLISTQTSFVFSMPSCKAYLFWAVNPTRASLNICVSMSFRAFALVFLQNPVHSSTRLRNFLSQGSIRHVSTPFFQSSALIQTHESYFDVLLWCYSFRQRETSFCYQRNDSTTHFYFPTKELSRCFFSNQPSVIWMDQYMPIRRHDRT